MKFDSLLIYFTIIFNIHNSYDIEFIYQLSRDNINILTTYPILIPIHYSPSTFSSVSHSLSYNLLSFIFIFYYTQSYFLQLIFILEPYYPNSYFCINIPKPFVQYLVPWNLCPFTFQYMAPISYFVAHRTSPLCSFSF